ncbi:MAG: flagellar basal body P-ring protein FlgI [Candidatus Wallbacteria bacterium]|nr:flagellar basal body P-ring protein FlgI [Candidatus Wallbacteria bacterium]
MRCEILALLLLFTAAGITGPVVRLKDICSVKGVRSNQLTGYGLVVGLNGTGDKSNIGILSAINMLKKFGIEADEKVLKPKNVAAVMVTADLGPFSKEGERIDVLISSLGDASSLQNGVLLQTPLVAADGRAYAVAGGALSVGVFGTGIAAGRGNQSHLTVGRLAGGAIVEREVPVDYCSDGSVGLLLDRKDFTTASRVEKAINDFFAADFASAVDAGELRVNVPFSLREQVPAFVARLLELSVTTDEAAQIVINERTGTIVMGEQVKVSKVAVVHGDLKVTIARQGGPGEGAGMVLEEGTDVESLVNALNSIGATPGDVISILQALSSAGALHATIKSI